MREISWAIVSPFAFCGRLRKLLRIIRWASFLAPLFGTCNKFRGHLLEMIERRRQRSASKAARKRWDDLIDAFSHQSKLERATLKLQRRFLEKWEHQAQRRFALLAPYRGSSNLRLSCKIRSRLIEEIRLSRLRLDKMEKLDSQRQVRSHVSMDERMSITQHKESERKRRRLLLSPKTSFAVGWKYFAVACVSLEISQMIFAPMLSGEMKKMPLDIFLLRILKASPDCNDKIVKKVAAPSFFVPVINNLGDVACATSLWERRWLVFARIFATLMVPVVNTIFFLDVFITFFTGELTSSGSLVPKPFFTRYIFPGIGLQLIVNPTMAEITRLVKRTIVHAIRVGPGLFLHLLLACAPLATSCYGWLLDMIFDFVERQNTITSRQ